MFQKATFIKRLNRFTVVCQINGRKTQAYLPNPGRLWEILIPGKTVYLKKQEKGLPFILWAAERQGQIMCLDTQYTNEVAKTLIESGAIKDLEGYLIKGREYKINGHRIDFLLTNGVHDLILEVKSCTLFHDSIAMFPDAVTLRGRKHLEILSKRNGA
ncbi:MAG: DNA/RNA nuclease SfsA, partial [Pseudothermotoga sp.]